MKAISALQKVRHGSRAIPGGDRKHNVTGTKDRRRGDDVRDGVCESK